MDAERLQALLTRRLQLEAEISEIDKELGQAVKAYRNSNGLRQEEFAAFAGLQQPHLSQIERNVRTPEYGTISSLSQAVVAVESTPPDQRVEAARQLRFSGDARRDAEQARSRKAK